MVEWPGRCSRCHEVIEDWTDAGMYQRHWIHKTCYADLWQRAQRDGRELAPLQPPTGRSAQLELPMVIFLLLFHFGLGAAAMGWIMISQFSDSSGNPILAFGIIAPLIGVVGVALNVISRCHIELIRQT